MAQKALLKVTQKFKDLDPQYKNLLILAGSLFILGIVIVLGNTFQVRSSNVYQRKPASVSPKNSITPATSPAQFTPQSLK